MFLADLHTHTRFSDGKNTLAEMVDVAHEKGLRQFGNSDHGLRHVAFGLERHEMPRLKRQVEQCRLAYPDMEILQGIEANIYCSYGLIDLKEEDYDFFDYVCAGYHQMVFPKNLADAFRYNLPGIFRKNFTQSQIDTYTRAYINVITSGRVQIIVHPCYGLPVNAREIAKAARDYGVYIELNGKKVSMSDEEVLSIVDEGATLIINSDSHRIDRVGDFSVPLQVVDRLNIDKEKIANWNKTVVFNKKTAYNR